MTVALCPGSFDPTTNGHVDVILRAARMFDRLIVGVVLNPSKTPMFTSEERVSLVRDSIGSVPNVEVESFEGLLVDFASRIDAKVIVKGIRGVGDMVSELQMAQMNMELSGIDTVMFPTSPKWAYVSSSLIREVATLGGSVDTLVPEVVAKALEEKLR